MLGFLTNQDWAAYKALMDEAHHTFNQKEITWLRQVTKTQRYGEEVMTPQVPITLHVLVNSNYMRTWPSNTVSESGEIDEESCQLFINKQYLSDSGLLNSAGYFGYNPDHDRFIIDGLMWKPFGDISSAQMSTDDLFILVILKRVKTPTGTQR